MRIAVCEDNAADRAAIRQYIERYCETCLFACDIHEFESGEALLSVFSPGVFDVVFLDIFLGGISGMEAAQKIRATDPVCALVFITVSEEYMRLSFSVRVTSYVLKPIRSEDMAVAFAACQNIFLKSARYIEVKSDYQSIRLPLVRIYYVEVAGRATLFHTASDAIRTYIPIDEVERTLGGGPFLRCHRAFIVNMNHIADMEDYDFIMRNGRRVSMRKNGRKELRTAVGKFMSHRMFEVGGVL